MRSTEPFGSLNVGINVVLSGTVVKIPLWIKHEHLNEYKELRWNFTVMRNAGKYAMKFIKNLDMASTLDDDLLYMIYLLKAIGEKETIKKELRDAYETLEDTCFESKYSAIFGSTMIQEIIWYIDITERDIYNYVDNMVYRAKTQITR